ncbi:MAG: FtsQ-type POTRA domain-containing protein [Candidatus Hydrogenedentes bacterium]|nr:FtsQ-type POTRA domain-containing protein [Candidatus Hydrogenedentota bacterium]
MALLLGVDSRPIVYKSPSYRNRKKHRKWLKAFGFFVSISLICIFLLSVTEFALESSSYAIKNVIVQGLESSSPEFFLKKVGLDLVGMNFFLITSSLIERKILSLPSVSSCKVEKIFPDTVIITVEEKIPFATLSINGNLFLIDHTAKVLKRIYSVKERVGPIITVVEVLSDIEEGDRIDSEGLWNAMNFWYEFNTVASGLGLNISEIVVERDEIKVFFDEILCETRWKKDEIDSQIQKLVLAVKKLNLKIFDGCKYIDLRFGNDIVFN